MMQRLANTATNTESALSRALESALAPLDDVRAASYRLLARPIASLLRQPERRTFILAFFYAGLCFVAAVACPLVLLAVGPIIWGIPHIVGDVRYLVVQPGYHKKRIRLLVLSLALAASVFGAGMWGGAAAWLLAVLWSDSSWPKRLLAALLPACVLLLLPRYQREAELFFAHAHNWVAVGYLAWAFGSRRYRWIIIALVATLAACLLAVPASAFGLLSTAPAGMGLGYHIATLVPAGAPPIALRLVFVFAFMQAFHYAVWVRLVPELRRRRRAPRSFVSSYRALCKDFGRSCVLVTVVAMLVLAVAALLWLREAREGYLRFALFHGYLELCFMTMAWLSPQQGNAEQGNAELDNAGLGNP